MATNESGPPGADQPPKSELIYLPDPALRSPSRRIGLIDRPTLELIGKMVDQARLWEQTRPHEITVGLAAVQINQPWRVVIVRRQFDKAAPPSFQALINPRITRTDGPEIEEYEGCLSVPDYYAKVKRAERIRFEALDLTGRSIVATAKGFLARVIQHEVDHLKGITIVDRVEEPETGFGRLNQQGKIEPVELAAVEARGLIDR